MMCLSCRYGVFLDRFRVLSRAGITIVVSMPLRFVPGRLFFRFCYAAAQRHMVHAWRLVVSDALVPGMKPRCDGAHQFVWNP